MIRPTISNVLLYDTVIAVTTNTIQRTELAVLLEQHSEIKRD